MGMVRITLLVAALLGLCWFNFFNDVPAHALAQSIMDRFDKRPARRILFVGNSRMFVNDMPHMVRKIADSAGAREKFQVTMWAQPGRTLGMHWQEGKAQSLLAQGGWNDFVLQAGSVEQSSEETRSAFLKFGAAFVEQANKHGARPTMIVGWVYGPSEFAELPEGAQQVYYQLMQSDHRKLQQQTGAAMVNVGGAFKDLTDARAPFPLMTDGNHPSIHGTYVSALMTYAHFAGSDGSEVTYVPPGMTVADAATIRSSVSASIRFRL